MESKRANLEDSQKEHLDFLDPWCSHGCGIFSFFLGVFVRCGGSTFRWFPDVLIPFRGTGGMIKHHPQTDVFPRWLGKNPSTSGFWHTPNNCTKADLYGFLNSSLYRHLKEKITIYQSRWVNKNYPVTNCFINNYHPVPGFSKKTHVQYIPQTHPWMGFWPLGLHDGPLGSDLETNTFSLAVTRGTLDLAVEDELISSYDFWGWLLKPPLFIRDLSSWNHPIRISWWFIFSGTQTLVAVAHLAGVTKTPHRTVVIFDERLWF